MEDGSLITDPRLLSVLQAAENVRRQSLAILDLIASFHAEGKTSPTNLEDLALSREQKLMNAHLARLRSLNRRAVLDVRAAKQNTAEARQEVDGLHLELQNLYYEQSHLRGEIVGCQEYDHKYLKLPMISAEDYAREHPEHEQLSEHEVTILRIQHENDARLKLHQAKEDLGKRKEALAAKTMAKKDELTKLDAEIEGWLGKHEAIEGLFAKHSSENGRATPATQI